MSRRTELLAFRFHPSIRVDPAGESLWAPTLDPDPTLPRKTQHDLIPKEELSDLAPGGQSIVETRIPGHGEAVVDGVITRYLHRTLPLVIEEISHVLTDILPGKLHLLNIPIGIEEEGSGSGTLEDEETLVEEALQSIELGIDLNVTDGGGVGPFLQEDLFTLYLESNNRSRRPWSQCDLRARRFGRVRILEKGLSTEECSLES